ncbi:NADH-quinone oxidoreductase subunit NuoE [Candidatus Poribacteria bacterium]
MTQKTLDNDTECRDLISVLKEKQEEHGYISQDVMVDVAEELGTSITNVYEVATFYSFLSTEPLGANVIKICKSVPCFLKSSESVTEMLKKELNIVPGEVTEDGKFSLHLTNCIGACDTAPAMMINEKVYGDLTPDKVVQILDEYRG